MRIYVANLRKYNEGALVGEWIDVPSSVDELQEEIARIVGADEWAIHDCEDYSLPEHPDLERVVEIADALEEYPRAVVEWAETATGKGDVLKDFVEERWQGEWSDLEDWAADYISGAYDLDKMLGELARYFDYEAFGRDAEMGGDIITFETANGIAVLSNI